MTTDAHPDNDRDGIAAVLAERWAELMRLFESDESWPGRGLLPVASLAHADAMFRGLFPFQSLNRLCFSRCSTWPYTNDFPCIGVGKGGDYGVDRYPFPSLGWDEPDPDRGAMAPIVFAAGEFSNGFWGFFVPV